MAEGPKRVHDPPTGQTPGKKPEKRRSGASGKFLRKSLFQSDTDLEQGVEQKNQKVQTMWKDEEVSALVEYIALYYSPDENSLNVWPAGKNDELWGKCADAVNCYNIGNKRSGDACRNMVRRYLKEKFPTIASAEEAYGISYFGNSKVSNAGQSVPSTPHVVSGHTTSARSPLLEFSPLRDADFTKLPGCILDIVSSGFSSLTPRQREQLLIHLFQKWMVEDINPCLDATFVPPQLLPLVANAMSVLRAGNKDNLIYYAARCFGEQRHGGASPRMPLDRMPFGLISHNLKFFSSDNVYTLQAPDDYKSWCQSMYTLFGNKWASMHLGPMWSYEIESEHVPVTNDSSLSLDIISQALQETFGSDSNMVSMENPLPALENAQDSNTNDDVVKSGRTIKGDPLKAKINIAGPGVRTIRRMNKASDFSKGTEIQISALKFLHEAFPNGRWWLKADGTDIQEGLRESMRNEWSGDVDLGDGKLGSKYSKYLEYLKLVRNIGLNDGASSNNVKEDLKKVCSKLSIENEFLINGHADAKKDYKNVQDMANPTEKALFACAWKVEEFSKLLEKNVSLSQSLNNIISILDSENTYSVNIATTLTSLRQELLDYVKGITTKTRVAASHILIFMVSDELRNFKPYAIPVRVLKYNSLTDKNARDLKDELKTAMEDIGMVTVGFVTDGEFNSLRTQGKDRPVSVIQLIMDAKNEARAIPAKEIEKFFKSVKKEGVVLPVKGHNAIPLGDVQWLAEYMNGEPKVSFLNAIRILRRKHFPFFYDPHPWVAGKTESKADCLKSLMAMYLFKNKVSMYCAQGVNFQDYLYVPEVSERTGEPQQEREDHNHVLKRIAGSLRKGHIPNVDLQAFVKAMNNAETGLTYTALTGKRKQSVGDAKKLLSPAVAKWLKANGFLNEGRFVEIVSNWHKASDGRGLTEADRKKYNLAMLDYLLEDWMPWYKEERDYSTLDVNRPIRGIRGFTREVVVVLTTNIESQEFRRRYGLEKGLLPEHPRAGSTDDVEGIFAFLHGLLGPIFDEKDFHDAFPKVISEYTKKCDPDLPFYYYTGSNDRYNDGLIQSFNVPSSSGEERLDHVCISRRADPGVFVSNRATIPQRGQLSVRTAHFKPAESLPPPPAP